MVNQVSRWFDVQYVPENHIFSPESRPGKLPVPLSNTIPVIDLKNLVDLDRTYIIQQISEACQRFGFFQVINHGVPENLMTDTMQVLKEFFNLPDEEKASVPNKSGWIYSGNNYPIDGVHLWRENIKHSCLPLDECTLLWPENPNGYRQTVAAYVTELRKLSLRILELICEGLGLEPGYFEQSSEVQFLSASNYPPCPDPSLTLGVPRHRDPSLITILFDGDVSGLQVFKDGQWIGVRAIPNAFVVNIGNQLEIISNRKLRSAEHRAVTNSSVARTSIATFVNPSLNCIVEPAKVLVNESNPSLYKPTLYKEFVSSSQAFGLNTNAIQNRISSNSTTA